MTTSESGPRPADALPADGDEVRADVRAWLRRNANISAMVGDLVALPSLPASVWQNSALDLVDQIVAGAPGARRDRWVPDWEAVAQLAAPLDAQMLYTPLIARDGAYADTLGEIETAVYSLHRGTGGPTLMLCGHTDVVPADDQDWSTAPFEPRVHDGRLTGRGAMDMKAGTVAAALAFRYLAEHWHGNGTLLLALVPEEETGGNGTLAALQRGYTPDAAIFTEPTDLAVVHRHIGIQAFDIDVTGRPGGMLRRSWGTSAIPTLARIAVALDDLERDRTARARAAGGYSDDDLPGFINTMLTAGEWIATRAATGHIEGLMSVLPGETQQDAEQELREAVTAAAASAGLPVSVQVRPGGHRGAELPVKHDLVTAFADSRAHPGEPGAPSRAGTMVCDAKIVQGGGWAPSIVLGPVGGNLHSADEWVDLASITTCVELVVRGALRYLAHT